MPTVRTPSWILVRSEAADPDALRGSWVAVTALFGAQVSLSVLGIATVKNWGGQARDSLAAGNYASPAIWWTMVGAAAYLISFLFWLVLLTRAPLSVIYPLSVGTTLCLTLLASIVLFDERPSPLQLTGSALILLGVGMIGSGLNR